MHKPLTNEEKMAMALHLKQVAEEQDRRLQREMPELHASLAQADYERKLLERNFIHVTQASTRAEAIEAAAYVAKHLPAFAEKWDAIRSAHVKWLMRTSSEVVRDPARQRGGMNDGRSGSPHQ